MPRQPRTTVLRDANHANRLPQADNSRITRTIPTMKSIVECTGTTPTTKIVAECTHATPMVAVSGFYALACGKEAGPRGSWTEEQERERDPITQNRLRREPMVARGHGPSNTEITEIRRHR